MFNFLPKDKELKIKRKIALMKVNSLMQSFLYKMKLEIVLFEELKKSNHANQAKRGVL